MPFSILCVNKNVAFSAGYKSFRAIINALEEFGSSKTLASPRLTVMNNQSAILKVAKNQVYFKLNYEKQFFTQAQRDSVSVSSDIRTVPIGIVLFVQPSIDLQSGKIYLFLRPTISRLNRSIDDPAVRIMAINSQINANINSVEPSMVPIVDVREIDSVLCLLSGELAVLGGIMDTRSYTDIKKIPIVGDIPLVGNLFSAKTEGDQMVELIILLRATIIEDGGSPLMHSDKKLYKTMTNS